MSCHPFDHVWSWDNDAGAERCENCQSLGEPNENDFMITIKCFTCGAWASHLHDDGYYCRNHGRHEKKGLRGALLDD